MSDIIDFSTKATLKESSSIETSTEENLALNVLNEILTQADIIEDILVYVISKDRVPQLFHTGMDIKERSYLVQLLNSDIQQEISPTEDIEFETDI